MTKEEAFNCYYKANKRTRPVLDVLLQWDPKKTAGRNAADLKLKLNNAYWLMRRYHLKSAKGYDRSQIINNLEKNPQLLRDMLEAGATQTVIGKVFGFTRSRIQQIIAGHSGNGPRRADGGYFRKRSELRTNIHNAVKKEPKATKQIMALFAGDRPKNRIRETIKNMARAKEIVNVAGRWAVPH